MTDIRFLLPLSLSGPVLLAHLYFAFYFDKTLCFCVVVYFRNVAFMRMGQKVMHLIVFICALLTMFKMCSNNSKIGFSRFCFLALDGNCFGLFDTKQTDSEQTDFAFDGETTATEVCT